MSTAIPYLDEVWNVTTGCGDDMASPGCLNCYARRMFGRNLWGYDFTPTFHADRLEQPLHWRKPRRVGVSFMGDLFHEAITDVQLALVFLMMAQVPRHTYLILTKRPERARDFITARIADGTTWREGWTGIPLPNVWLGVTVCNQAEADRNVPILRDTPAAVRWVSLEPMLGPVDLGEYLCPSWCRQVVTNEHGPGSYPDPCDDKLDLVVLGGETGPGARPMMPEWALDVCRQCKAAGVPFWWKQWGTSRADHRQSLYGPDLLDMEATHELPGVTP